MTLVKRGKIWWIDYTAGGKRYRKSTGSTNKAVAAAFMNQIDIARKMPSFEAAVEVLRQFYDKPPEGKIPLEAGWETYWKLARATGKNAIAEDTQRKRRNALERFLRHLRAHFGAVKYLEHVTGLMAADFAEALARELATHTRRNIIGDLSTIWKLLEKASTGIKNPWENLAPPDTDGERGKAFTAEDEEKVLAAADKFGADWPQICRLMRLTGQRYGDICRLTWSEIGEKTIILTPHKTARHKITVPIPITPELRKILDSIEKRGDYLFPLHADLYGRRGATTKSGIAFSNVLKLAGLEKAGYTIHSWRHTAATRLAEAGIDKETRKKILGHRVDATAERYDHADHLEAVAAALEAISPR